MKPAWKFDLLPSESRRIARIIDESPRIDADTLPDILRPLGLGRYTQNILPRKKNLGKAIINDLQGEWCEQFNEFALVLFLQELIDGEYVGWADEEFLKPIIQGFKKLISLAVHVIQECKQRDTNIIFRATQIIINNSELDETIVNELSADLLLNDKRYLRKTVAKVLHDKSSQDKKLGLAAFLVVFRENSCLHPENEFFLDDLIIKLDFSRGNKLSYIQEGIKQSRVINSTPLPDHNPALSRLPNFILGFDLRDLKLQMQNLNYGVHIYFFYGNFDFHKKILGPAIEYHLNRASEEIKRTPASIEIDSSVTLSNHESIKLLADKLSQKKVSSTTRIMNVRSSFLGFQEICSKKFKRDGEIVDFKSELLSINQTLKNNKQILILLWTDDRGQFVQFDDLEITEVRLHPILKSNIKEYVSNYEYAQFKDEQVERFLDEISVYIEDWEKEPDSKQKEFKEQEKLYQQIFNTMAQLWQEHFPNWCIEPV